jgi:hypothetical protein
LAHIPIPKLDLGYTSTAHGLTAFRSSGKMLMRNRTFVLIQHRTWMDDRERRARDAQRA